MATTKTKNLQNSALTVARNVYPEDLCVGDQVVLSDVSFEFPSFLWCGADTTVFPPEKPIRISFLPMFDQHEPMTVRKICLPFVLCKPIQGDHRIVDLRQAGLARVDKAFATTVKRAKTSDSKTRKGSRLKKSAGKSGTSEKRKSKKKSKKGKKKK